MKYVQESIVLGNIYVPNLLCFVIFLWEIPWIVEYSRF